MRVTYWLYPVFVNAYYLWLVVSLVVAAATSLRRIRALYGSPRTPRQVGVNEGAVPEGGTTLRETDDHVQVLRARQVALSREAAATVATLRGLTRVSGAAIAMVAAFGTLVTIDRPFNHPTRTLTGGDIAVELAFMVLPHVVVGLAILTLLCIASSVLECVRHRRRLAWLRSRL